MADREAYTGPYSQRNVNMRQDVLDLIEGECAIRRNGPRGFSLTLNQIVLEYFEMTTPRGVELAVNQDGKPLLAAAGEQPA